MIKQIRKRGNFYVADMVDLGTLEMQVHIYPDTYVVKSNILIEAYN